MFLAFLSVFTPETILNCYGLGTFAVIQPNVNQVCVQLQPENSDICAKFPHGITATLNMNIILTTILTDFSYANTKQICFQCIPDAAAVPPITEAQCTALKDTEFASMTINGISLVSSIPIGAIMTSNSDFDNCFYQDDTSFFSISSSLADFALNATGICDELFNDGEIQKVDVFVLYDGWNKYQRVEFIKPQYIRYWPSRFYLSGDNMFSLIISETIQSAMLQFYIELGGTIITTQTQLSTYKFFDFQQCYTNYTLQTTYDYFTVNIQPVEGFIETEEAKVTGKYNEIILRTQFVSMTNSSETYTYQVKPLFKDFKFKSPGNVFSCKDEEDEALCLQQRAKIIDTGVYNYYITFQMMLLKDSQLRFSGSFSIPSINASFCLQNSIAVIEAGEIKVSANMSSYFNNSTQCAFSKNNYVLFQYFNDDKYSLSPLVFIKYNSEDIGTLFFPCQGYCQNDAAGVCQPVDEELCPRFQTDLGQRIQINYYNMDAGNQIDMILESVENKDYGDFFTTMLIFAGGLCAGMLAIVISFIVYAKFSAQIHRKIEEKARIKEAQKKKMLDED